MEPGLHQRGPEAIRPQRGDSEGREPRHEDPFHPGARGGWSMDEENEERKVAAAQANRGDR